MSEATWAKAGELDADTLREALKANPDLVRNDPELLQDLGLRIDAANVVEFGPAALTRVVEAHKREAGARKQLEATARANFAAQALLAAKAGASYISPFIGRLDDHGADGMSLIGDIRTIYDNYDFDTEILAASIRTTEHVRDAAIHGADCATIPPSIFEALFKHPLTDKGLEMFMSDWAKTGQSIL